jgi:hypothetical protein
MARDPCPDAHARITELEEELAVARRHIADREETIAKPPEAIAEGALDRVTHGGGPAVETSKAWFGAAMRLKMARRFEGLYPEHRFDELLERIREVTDDPGEIVELSAKTVVWSSSGERHVVTSNLMVRVRVEGQYTMLSVSDRLGALAGRMFGGFGAVVGATGIALPIAASLTFPIFTAAFVVGWLGSVYGTTRAFYRRIARARAERVQELFGAVALEIERYAR